MKLPAHEAFLFFELMLPLQFFVNQKLGILKDIDTILDYKNASFQDKFRVRNALFDNIYLIDEFIDENPPDIPLKDLAIVSSWKRFVSGNFYVVRHLKNHTIFIGDEYQVYAVQGLTHSLGEVFPDYLIPQITTAVLLPFHEKIVADGFFTTDQIYIRNYIKSRLKEVYNQAKKKKTIIQTL